MFRTSTSFKLLLKTLYSTKSTPNVLERLNQRTLIRISGNEVCEYLQGLITNDIRHLDHGGGCMYTMFLNTKGRVLYDTIIYKSQENNTFLIECDVAVKESLQRLLKMYRIRRKIDIASVCDEYKIFALFNPSNTEIMKSEYGKLSSINLDGIIVPCDALNETLPKDTISVKIYKDLYIYRDPRTYLLGYRVIAPHNTETKDVLSEIYSVDDSENEKNYKWFRYNLGVGEGVNELPPENSFPLEANCDYLHGVSFHKGCYIGQELTARTHHTGVVRKRLMPLFFTKIPTVLPENDTIVHNNVNLGKLRGVEGDCGLGLLRIIQSLDCNEINIGNGIAKTERPVWWPVEASKDKIRLQKQ